jgi:hypothetical protein
MDRNMSETGIEERFVRRQTEFYMKRIDFDLSDLQKISFEISMNFKPEPKSSLFGLR